MNSVVLACTTLRKAVQCAQEFSKTNYPVYELDRAYHDDPAKMRQHILETLAALPEEVDTVLVAMGFCGGSWQDVSCGKRLVIPKVADCVALTLTTEDTYSPDLKQPGHMYLFGDKQSGFSIRAIYDSLMEKYDKEMAEAVFQMYFEHYYYLDIVDNGLYDCYDPSYVEQAQRDVDQIHAELDFVPGSNILLEKLVSGQWDTRFVILSPKDVVKQGNFYE